MIAQGSRGLLQMLEPPERGDKQASQWAFAGIGIYIVLSGVFLGTLLSSGDIGSALLDLVGLGSPLNLSIFVLVVGGIGLTVYAMSSIFRDISLIRREEDDIDWLLTRGREGAALVLAPASERERLFAAQEWSVPTEGVRVETLADDRVRRAYAARASGGTSGLSVEELRIIAERRTARYGGFARYASSLLLLLAVLGTFAGVKTALPGLIDAVATAEEGVAEGVSGSTIEAPLRAVADAFGANALALIGAIAIGLMGHGVGIGRRNLLERLELASAEYVYQDHTETSDPLRAAIHALLQTAREIQSSSGALLGIEGGLERVGADFRDAFRGLDDRLSEILEHQESGLYDRTSQALEELQIRIGSLLTAVDGNARIYSGLIDRVGERAEESRSAVREMQLANAELTRALESILRLSDSSVNAAAQTELSTRQLGESTQIIAEQIGQLTQSVREAQPVFSRVEAVLEQTAERATKIEERAARAWSDTSEEIRRKMDGVISEIRQQRPVAAERQSHQSVVAASSGESGSAFPSILLFVLPLLGTLGGLMLVYLFARFGVFVPLPTP